MDDRDRVQSRPMWIPWAMTSLALLVVAMVAFVLADAFLEKLGGDSIDEIAQHLAATNAAVERRFTAARSSASPAR